MSRTKGIRLIVNRFPEAKVCDDKFFRSQEANSPINYDPLVWGEGPVRIVHGMDAEAQIAHRMAGHRRLDMKRVNEIKENANSATEYERWFFHELFNQANVEDCYHFMGSLSATPRQMAALFRVCNVQAASHVYWINSWADDPDWKPDPYVEKAEQLRALNRELEQTAWWRKRRMQEMKEAEQAQSG